MSILLAELCAEIGCDNVGRLELVSAHRPEARTKLTSMKTIALRHIPVEERAASDVDLPARLLPRPVPLTFMPDGVSVSIDNHWFRVESSSQTLRIDQVEWWTPSPVCRDYKKVWLTSGQKNVHAWVYTDRLTGKAFLHGYFD